MEGEREVERGGGAVVSDGGEGVVVLLGEGEGEGSAKKTLGVGKMGCLDLRVVFVGIG